MSVKLSTMANVPIELNLRFTRPLSDPFNEAEVDVLFTDPEGEEKRVPAFWSGGEFWRVRYASPMPGTHHFRSLCDDCPGEGSIEVRPCEDNNPLFACGPVRIGSERHFEHQDGTPFFWLGDTWWMGLCNRLGWPDEFQLLTADRVEKGFTVIQIVAGLYPDMPPFDPRGANEAGFPWEENFTRINPAYFDMADLRINWLVHCGLVPCIFGCWGYYADLAGKEVLRKHWRYLVARYASYPVVWSMAGEAIMPYYLTPPEEREEKSRSARTVWTELTHYVHAIDPFKRPITLHPNGTARSTVEDPSLLDFDMLQTGHGGWKSLPNTITLLQKSRSAVPEMPVVVGEVCYEGIRGSSWEDVQRTVFWSSVLAGASGFTYGANGLWQLNREDEPFGASPHGSSWGGLPWTSAYRLPGSQQLGLAKRLLTRFKWWEFEPHPDWLEPHSELGDPEAIADNPLLPYCAGIPSEIRVIYIPISSPLPTVKSLESGVKYRAFYFNPRTGQETALGLVEADTEHNWQPPRPPIFQDWVLVLETEGARIE